MASRYENEFHHYTDVIDGRIEAPPEANLWENVRLPLTGKPKFLATLTSPQHRLFCIVELGMYMGEGTIRIPVGLYSSHPDQADEAVVTHNRLQLNYTDNEPLDEIAVKIGLRWEWPIEGIECSSGGGYEIFTTLGYELTLHRSLNRMPKHQLILLPRDDTWLHVVAAHGLTEHIHDVLGHIRIDPIKPPELQLTTS